MEQIAIVVLLAVILLGATAIVTLEDRRSARQKATRVHAALVRIGEAAERR